MNHEAFDAFNNPANFHRGAPFWIWNNKLDPDQLSRQIDIFKTMDLDGFHMHPRTGLDTEYMGTDYMESLCRCVEKAKQENMLAWRYDEDHWPSGAAGGLVTKDQHYRARHLLFSPNSIEDVAGDSGPAVNTLDQGGRSRQGRLLAVYDIRLDEYQFWPMGLLGAPRVLEAE